MNPEKALFIYLLFYFFIVFVLRTYVHWKRTGINALTFTNSDDAHGYNGKLFTFISILEFAVIFIYAFIPNWYEYLLPFWYLEIHYLKAIGWCLLIISLIVVWLAQSQMRASWRIGIDEINDTQMVTTGFYAFSRNPIFLGVMIANMGIFLIIPNAFTLLIISLSTVSINTQVRLEEEFLSRKHGVNYQKYRKTVRRWI